MVEHRLLDTREIKEADRDGRSRELAFVEWGLLLEWSSSCADKFAILSSCVLSRGRACRCGGVYGPVAGARSPSPVAGLEDKPDSCAGLNVALSRSDEFRFVFGLVIFIVG
jgi:hypothetical protein